MKKNIFGILVCSLALFSCNMELTPEGEIHDEEALESIEDFESFTRGLYAMARSFTSGDNVVLSDIQLDDFHAVIGNGNRRMDFYNGSILPSTGEIAAIYSSYYAGIAEINFFLDHAESKLADGTFAGEDAATLSRCVGAAHFLRAYCYASLADKYCGSYRNAADIEEEGTGLSLQLSYAPTADNSKYPGRSSLKVTYAQILSDLGKALEETTAYEEASDTEPRSNSIYITSDAVKALTARVHLTMGNAQRAFALADEVIATNRYPLTDRNSFAKLWTDDEGSEILWLVDADYTYHGSATGDAFASNTTKSDYLPTKECIFLFDENDIRWTTWFDEKEYQDGDTKILMCRFMKYPGNPDLYATGASSNFVQKGKPLRSAELYLIAAEACQDMGDEQKAIQYLSALETTRIKGSQVAKRIAALSGTALRDEIRDERHREMIGEGSRLADLKRWQSGFTRGEIYENHEGLIISNYMNQHYDADDYRFLWPLPQHELDTNPQVRGQQNPGYDF